MYPGNPPVNTKFRVEEAAYGPRQGLKNLINNLSPGTLILASSRDPHLGLSLGLSPGLSLQY